MSKPKAILFVGIPGSGKSSFYKKMFSDTHLHISLDKMRTRSREGKFFDLCLKTRQQFVIDNTNVARSHRQRYLPKINPQEWDIECYYFSSPVKDSIKRNKARERTVPTVAIKSMLKALEVPDISEGFDRLYYVTLTDKGFDVSLKN